jgi:hypothetical protein
MAHQPRPARMIVQATQRVQGLPLNDRCGHSATSRAARRRGRSTPTVDASRQCRPGGKVPGIDIPRPQTLMVTVHLTILKVANDARFTVRRVRLTQKRGPELLPARCRASITVEPWSSGERRLRCNLRFDLPGLKY